MRRDRQESPQPFESDEPSDERVRGAHPVKKFLVRSTALLVAGSVAWGGWKVWDENHIPEEALPMLNELPVERPATAQALICADDQIDIPGACTSETALGVLASGEDFTPVDYEKLKTEAPHVIQAFKDIEDTRFDTNDGCDFQAIVAAITKGRMEVALEKIGVGEAGRQRGASGIARQVAGLIYPPATDEQLQNGSIAVRQAYIQAGPRWAAQLHECQLARTMVVINGKDWIMEQYMNRPYMGRGANGIVDAADAYYDKEPYDLTYDEARAIVGNLSAPSVRDLNFTAEQVTPEIAQKHTVFVVDLARKKLVAEKLIGQRYDIDLLDDDSYDAIEAQVLGELSPEAYAVEAAAYSDEEVGEIANSLSMDSVVNEANLQVTENELSAADAEDITIFHRYIVESRAFRNKYESMLNSDVSQGRLTKAEADAKRGIYPKFVPYTPKSSEATDDFSNAESIGARHVVADEVINEALAILQTEVDPDMDRDKMMSFGYKIYTTINTHDQRAMHDALMQSPAVSQYDINGAGVSLRRDGAVNTMIGSDNYQEVGINIALGTRGGGSGRAAGSSNKPYALAVAVQDGLKYDTEITIPLEVVFDGDNTENPYVVDNRQGCGWLDRGDPPCQATAGEAIAVSSNTYFAQIAKDKSIDRIAKLMTELGMNTGETQGPAMILGSGTSGPIDQAVGLNHLVLNQGTTNFHGENKKPFYTVSRIEDAAGNIIYDGPEIYHTTPISREHAVETTRILFSGVTDPHSTSHFLYRPAGDESTAGKTGTADRMSDLWFNAAVADADPELEQAISMWIGYADGNRGIDVDGIGSDDVTAIVDKYLQTRRHNSIPASLTD